MGGIGGPLSEQLLDLLLLERAETAAIPIRMLGVYQWSPLSMHEYRREPCSVFGGLVWYSCVKGWMPTARLVLKS